MRKDLNTMRVLIPASVVAASFAFLAAGCGGGSSPGVANVARHDRCDDDGDGAERTERVRKLHALPRSAELP